MDIYSIYYLLVFNNRQKGLPHSLFFFFCWILGPFGAPVLFLYGVVLTIHHLILVGHMPNNHKSIETWQFKRGYNRGYADFPLCYKRLFNLLQFKIKASGSYTHSHSHVSKQFRKVYLFIYLFLPFAQVVIAILYPDHTNTGLMYHQ